MPGQQDNVIRRLVRWAESRPDIRAMLLTSTRANPQARVDEFSDYDIILAVTDHTRYSESDGWLEDLGPVLTLYRDPISTELGFETFCRVTHYEDGTKIDFIVLPVGLLRRIAEQPGLPDYLDVGYAVLVDKDGLTANLAHPTYRAHIPAVPTQKEYQDLVGEFFSETLYVAKHICRDDLLPLKHCLDCVAKQNHLRVMLEWRAELDHNWSLRPGAYGKNLKQYVAPALWSQLESTYVGSGRHENWEALLKTIGLFRGVAGQVAAGLGYSYPHSQDRRVTEYLNRVRASHR